MFAVDPLETLASPKTGPTPVYLGWANVSRKYLGKASARKVAQARPPHGARKTDAPPGRMSTKGGLPVAFKVVVGIEITISQRQTHPRCIARREKQLRATHTITLT